MKNYITNDLQKHFSEKLHLLITDIVETGECAEVPAKEIVTLLMTELLHELVTAACMLHLDEEKFIEMTTFMYRFLIGGIRKKMENTK